MTEPIQQSVSLNDQPHQFDPAQVSLVIEPVAINGQRNASSPAHYVHAEDSQPSQSNQSGPNLGRSLGQIFIILVVLLVLVNIPFNNYSTGLAQLMPHSTPIVIRDGLLFKGSGPEIYVVDNYTLRQVSPEALKEFFSHYRKINRVEDSLLQQFKHGPPIYRLLQCSPNPDIYAVEDGYKRRVTEPPLNAIQVWDEVHFIRCSYLERLPDGPPIHDLGKR